MSDPSLERLFEPITPELRMGLQPAGPVVSWRDTLSPRRWLVAAVLSPLLFLAYRGAIAPPAPTGFGWTVLLLAIAVIGSLALATYVPQRGAGAGTSPCAAIAGAWVLFAWTALSGVPADPVNGSVALALVSLALVQRLRGASACGVRS